MWSVIKYRDRHQSEVIFVTSTTHFSTLFLQKKRQSEFSEFRSAHDISPYNPPFTFTGKEWCKSQWLAQRGPERGISETGYGYFGARYYDSDLSGLFLSVDPMADKYPSISPYAYCAWNPVKYIDPNGMDSIANAGQGYKVTEDGMYLYGEGLQTKKWNPDLEVGGVVGLRGGYENCDDNEFPDMANAEKKKASVAVPVAITAGNILLEVLSSILDAAITASPFIWVFSACMLVSGESSPHQEIKGESKIGNNTDSDVQDRTIQPFAHDTKKGGKLKGARSDRHAAQYNHGGKKRKPNPNQRKGALKRRNKGKIIN